MLTSAALAGLASYGAVGLALRATRPSKRASVSLPTSDRSAVPAAISTRYLQPILALSAALLEAHDEESTLRAVMRVGCESLGADGCLFMPFDEFSQRLSPLEFGHLFPPESGEWSSLLSKPSQRQTCKVCATRHAEHGCAMLNTRLAGGFVHCVPLRADGREAGLFSFVFSTDPQVDESAEWFLAESMHLVEVALDVRARVALVKSSRIGGVQLPALSDEMESLLPQIEFRAVVNERTRLAREIHDGLAQTLAFLKIEIDRARTFLQKGNTDQASQILNDSSRTIGDACLDARQAIENLRRVPNGRLETWLPQVAEDFESLTSLPVDLDLRLTSDFAPNQQVQLIRIVQEALTNIRKHAEASRVRIAAWEDGQEAVIEVADNGCGFSPSDSITAARFGLRGMRERAESIGAEFQVVSYPNEGTTVRLHIPLCVGVKS